MTVSEFFYETPDKVAALLSKYIPNDIDNMLDPSVGTGALLSPLIEQWNATTNITAIDINSTTIKNTRNHFSKLRKNIKFICADFIAWGQKEYKKNSKFDCVIMNPPFCSRRGMYVKLDILNAPAINNKNIPREIAFLYLGINLLKENGILVALLPGSVVSSKENDWFRQELLSRGTIKLVHELPKFTFPGVESKIYLLVYENKISKKKIKFLNHSITHSTSFSIPKSELCDEIRLDYSYIESRKAVKNIIDKSKLEWVKLSEVADIYRGDYSSQEFKEKAIHTNNYINGFWFRKSKYKQLSKNVFASPGDIIVKRVGRNCLESIGLFVSDKNTPCTDCVLIIKAKSIKNRNLLLFSLRCWVNSKHVKKTLHKGTGATYVSSSDLLSLMIPINLHKKYYTEYRAYLSAMKNKKFNKMQMIESSLVKKI